MLSLSSSSSSPSSSPSSQSSLLPLLMPLLLLLVLLLVLLLYAAVERHPSRVWHLLARPKRERHALFACLASART